MAAIAKYISFLIIIFIAIGARAFAGECKPHIEIWGAADWAKELQTTEFWVVRNYRILLWEKESKKNKGKSVGKLLPGSRAIILETGADDYKVKSPLDDSVGWINKIQVQRVLNQDIETRKPCE